MGKSMELRLFLQIVGNACYRDGVQIKGFSLQRGQWLRSNRKLQTDLSASPNKLVKAIQWLTESGLITTEKTQLGTLFTVQKFYIYQGNERYPTDNTQPLERYLYDNTQPLERYPVNNARCYPVDNKTNKELNNKTNNKERVNNLYSGGKHDERNSQSFNWEDYSFKF
jgi:DNA-binding transcriptional MocR family regulator